MELEGEIRKLIESMLADGQFLVDVLLSSRQGPKKILVIVDADQGIGIDDCAAISRKLSEVLDGQALVNDSYTLEVSTPGLEQPLKLKRQYRKNVGRKLKVKLHDRSLEGKLEEVSDDRIMLALEKGHGRKKEITREEIPFVNIEKAFVLVSFK